MVHAVGQSLLDAINAEQYTKASELLAGPEFDRLIYTTYIFDAEELAEEKLGNKLVHAISVGHTNIIFAILATEGFEEIPAKYIATAKKTADIYLPIYHSWQKSRNELGPENFKNLFIRKD